MLYAQLPVDGHYFWDLFPAFLMSGIGMAFAFIPMTIGALAGVRTPTPGRVGADQHQPADRRGDRHRGGHHHRGDRDGELVTAHPGAASAGGPALTHGFAPRSTSSRRWPRPER